MLVEQYFSALLHLFRLLFSRRQHVQLDGYSYRSNTLEGSKTVPFRLYIGFSVRNYSPPFDFVYQRMGQTRLQGPIDITAICGHPYRHSLSHFQKVIVDVLSESTGDIRESPTSVLQRHSTPWLDIHRNVAPESHQKRCCRHAQRVPESQLREISRLACENFG